MDFDLATRQSTLTNHLGTPRPKGRFLDDESGSITLFSVFIFLCMFMVVGLAIDFMRFETRRVEVQNTLDRAVLAAADLEQTLDARTVVQEYFAAAGLGGLVLDTFVQEGLNNKTVAASTSARLNSLFMHSLGIDHMMVPAQGAADERISDVEISLVLDVSGSMRGTKIASLKAAAKTFVDTVITSGGPVVGADSLTHISVVPYNHQTNAGPVLGNYLNFTGEHAKSYCADWQPADFRSASVTPATSIRQTGHFDYSNIRPDSSWWMPECRTFSYNQIQAFQSNAPAVKGFIDSLVASGNTSIDIGAKWGVTLLNPGLQPVINDMIATNQLDGAFAGRPHNYGTGALKVMILMTDGMNTSQYELTDGHRSGMSYFWHDPGTDTLSVDLEAYAHTLGHTAASVGLNPNRRYYRQYGDVDTSTPTGGANAVQLSWQQAWEWGGLSYVYSRVMYKTYRQTSVPWPLRKAAYYWRMNAHKRYSTSQKDPRASDICTAGKAAGIVVYTIGFETGASGDAVLSDCASSASHFFKASTTDIADAFSAIASEINQLKLIY